MLPLHAALSFGRAKDGVTGMADNERGEGVDTVEQPLPSETEAARGGFFQRLGLTLLLGFVLWVVGACAVLWWQPNRFIQLGVIAVAVVAALLIPKRHFDRILAAFACLLLIGALFYLPSYLMTTVVEFQIRNTDRDAARETYLIHTNRGAKTPSDPGETFENIDAPLLWKVNSSDVQGQAESLKGQRVRARVFGIRFADFSQYRNVIWLEPAT